MPAEIAANLSIAIQDFVQHVEAVSLKNPGRHRAPISNRPYLSLKSDFEKVLALYLTKSVSNIFTPGKSVMRVVTGLISQNAFL